MLYSPVSQILEGHKDDSHAVTELYDIRGNFDDSIENFI